MNHQKFLSFNSTAHCNWFCDSAVATAAAPVSFSFTTRCLLIRLMVHILPFLTVSHGRHSLARLNIFFPLIPSHLPQTIAQFFPFFSRYT